MTKEMGGTHGGGERTSNGGDWGVVTAWGIHYEWFTKENNSVTLLKQKSGESEGGVSISERGFIKNSKNNTRTFLSPNSLHPAKPRRLGT